VVDPEKAALEVQNYPAAVSWAAQTALRDIIGGPYARQPAARTREDRRRSADADRSAFDIRGA
jgi:regulator of protease activity HflC (stomatin/prohibitin superfamily)